MLKPKEVIQHMVGMGIVLDYLFTTIIGRNPRNLVDSKCAVELFEYRLEYRKIKRPAMFYPRYRVYKDEASGVYLMILYCFSDLIQAQV